MRKSNYDKFPSIKMNGMIVTGWDAIRTVLEKTGKTVVAVDLYVGTYEDEIVGNFRRDLIPSLTRELL